MKRESVQYGAKSKYIFFWRILLVIGVICVYLSNEREKVRTYECNYHFFPRADLTELYEELPDFKKAVSNVSDIQADLTCLKTASIVGNTYQNYLSEYIVGFDMYEATKLNEMWSVLFDTGKIMPGLELSNKSQIYFFDICALKYNGADLVNTRLNIQNNSKDIILGYARVVYASPSGKIKSKIIPLQDNLVTVDTKSGRYFLKEICIFSAYEQDTYILQDEILYQIKKENHVIDEFTLHRVNAIEK